MYPTVLCIVLLCTASTDRLFVSGLEAEILIGADDVENGIAIINRRVAHSPGITRIYAAEKQYTHIYKNDCGGFITQDAGVIEKHINLTNIKVEDEKCKWTIQAPENHFVYVLNLLYQATSNGYHDDQVGNYYDAPRFSIFDGSEVHSSSRLFRLGEDRLDAAISSGRNLTIFFHTTKKSDRFISQKIEAYYGFIDEKHRKLLA